MPYVDPRGRKVPPEGWHGPGHVFLGNVSRGRVVLDTLGRRLKVMRVGDGSVVVRRRAGTDREFQTSEGQRVRIKRPPRVETLAPGTVVRFLRAPSSECRVAP